MITLLWYIDTSLQKSLNSRWINVRNKINVIIKFLFGKISVVTSIQGTWDHLGNLFLRLADIEKKLWLPKKKEGGGRIIEEFGINIYMLLYKIDKQQGSTI